MAALSGIWPGDTRVARLPLAVLSISLIGCSTADRLGHFERISPEQAGFSAERLTALEEHLEQAGSAAFLALYDGKAFFSWGEVFEEYPVHSIRKALLNSLYGIYVERTQIDTSMTLGELGIDDLAPSLTSLEKRAQVADLLRSRSGVYHPAAAEAPSMMEQRPARGSREPGAFFYYNNWDFNALGTIFEQETGERIFEAFEREIARPLGMLHFSADNGVYHREGEKSEHAAYHFWMTAHDLALYGLLYLRAGMWNGDRIVPEDWIHTSTTTYSVYSADTGVGYGCLWYTLSEDAGLGKTFFHTGAGVHLLAVFADLELVIVHRVDTEAGAYRFTGDDLNRVFDLFFAARASGSG